MYIWEGMEKISYEEALRLMKKHGQGAVYLLYPDETEGQCESVEQLEVHHDRDGEFGVEKPKMKGRIPYITPSNLREIELFELGIKPAVLIQNYSNVNVVREVSRILRKPDVYFAISDRGEGLSECFIHRNKMLADAGFDHTDLSVKRLGIELGYYPPACERKKGSSGFEAIGQHRNRTFLNFGGINFSANEHLFDALRWCADQYLDKMLKAYEAVRIYVRVEKIDRDYGFTIYSREDMDEILDREKIEDILKPTALLEEKYGSGRIKAHA